MQTDPAAPPTPELGTDFLEICRKRARKLSRKLNELPSNSKKPGFMCHKCGKTFVRTKGMYLNTTEEGEQRPFCRACAMHCKTCDEWVSPALMVADHADCEADALVDEQGPSEDSGEDDSGEDDSEESFVAADDESLSGQEEEEGDEEEEEEDESSDK